MIPVSAPPRVRARLLASPDGPVRVLHHGAHALYVEVGGRCVGVVDQHATQVPCALSGRDLDLSDLGRGTARVEAGVLHLSGVPLAIGRMHAVTVPALHPASLPDVEPRPAPLDTAAVTRLVGLGDGLTPWGDDVLCGWLALHRAAGVPTPTIDEAVMMRSGHTTHLSATLLECAALGEVVPEFAAYVEALGGPTQGARERELLAVGHSTGSGLLQGAYWAAAEIRAAVAA